MTTYIVLAVAVGLAALVLWAYRAGGKGKTADHMEQVNDDFRKAVEIRETVEHMPAADVRKQLLARRVRRDDG